MRVVFDTNVLVSAVIGPQSLPAIILSTARQGHVQMLISPVLLEELQRVLREKLRFETDAIESTLRIINEHSEIIRPQHTLRVVQNDPDDDRVLECALEGKADVIVTGDRHLLALKKFCGIPLMTIREFFDSIHHA